MYELTSKTLTAEEALTYLKDDTEVMVRPYGDADDDDFVGINLEDFEDESDEEILEYLKEKEEIELWYYKTKE